MTIEDFLLGQCNVTPIRERHRGIAEHMMSSSVRHDSDHPLMGVV